MARDSRHQARSPRERAEEDAARSRELISGGTLSHGEQAVALACLAHAEMAIATFDLLASRLALPGESDSGEAFRDLTRELKETSRAMTTLAMGLRDSAHRA
jgi:hypothetical protein